MKRVCDSSTITDTCQILSNRFSLHLEIVYDENSSAVAGIRTHHLWIARLYPLLVGLETIGKLKMTAFAGHLVGKDMFGDSVCVQSET